MFEPRWGCTSLSCYDGSRWLVKIVGKSHATFRIQIFKTFLRYTTYLFCTLFVLPFGQLFFRDEILFRNKSFVNKIASKCLPRTVENGFSINRINMTIHH